MHKRITTLLKELGCYPVPDYVLAGLEQNALDSYLKKTVNRQLVVKLIGSGPKPLAAGESAPPILATGAKNKRVISILKDLGCYPVPDHVLVGIEESVEAGLDGYLKETVTLQLAGKLLSAGPAAEARKSVAPAPKPASTAVSPRKQTTNP